MALHPLWFTLLSDLCVNLAAGWLGAAFVIPPVSGEFRRVGLRLFFFHSLTAVAFLLAAFILQSKAL